MRTFLLLASAGLLAAAATPSTVAARPLHHAHRRADPSPAAYGPAGDGPARERSGDGFNAGAAQLPPPGNYDGYQGPGSTVLRRGLAAQHEPGAAEELSPGAKQTATGGPVGGLPGFGGGM